VTDNQAPNFSPPGRFYFHPHREASGCHAKNVSVCCVARHRLSPLHVCATQHGQPAPRTFVPLCCWLRRGLSTRCLPQHDLAGHRLVTDDAVHGWPGMKRNQWLEANGQCLLRLCPWPILWVHYSHTCRSHSCSWERRQQPR
jgi:hypothetical protein